MGAGCPTASASFPQNTISAAHRAEVTHTGESPKPSDTHLASRYHHTPPASGAGGGQGAPRSNQGDPPPSSPGPKVAGSAPRTSRELGGGAPLTSQRGRPAAQPQHQRQPLRAAPPRSPAAHAAGLRRARGGEAPLGPAEPAQFTPPDLFFILFFIILPAPPPLGAGPGQWRRSAASPTAPLGSALPLPLRPPSAGRIPNEPPLPHSQLAARGGH